MISFEQIQKWTIELDNAVWFWNLRQHRTTGGRLDRWFSIERHSLSAPLLPAGVCALLLLASPVPMRLALDAVAGRFFRHRKH